MGRRTLLLIASILVAAVGTALIALYVRGADARAREDTEQVSVQFARQDIAAGTPVDQVFNGQNAGVKTVAINSVPSNAISDTSGISGRTTVDIVAGAPLQRSMFGKVAVASNTPGLERDRVAASFELSDPQRVAGILQPGLYVTVYSVPTNGRAQQLLKSVKVLQIGTQTTGSSSTSTSQRTNVNADQVPRAVLTFNLRDQDEIKLLTAQQKGDLVLGLLGDQSIGNSP
jgi:pilus assembly protein CpaB